ncbi:MAG: alcohol dehydrogenase catalytic domain-containing protein [Solirubrobacteraceae bacterium]|jgi:2-desacetyl-2-hydroxyethyl bacteriochlorophyllide A dehydrogenase
MKAACYVGERTLKTIEAQPREPAAGEVRLDVSHTGICGTDLHILHGAMDARVHLPAVLGHEMSGTIAQIGEGVEAWSPGDRVTVMPLAWCGHCPACRAGCQHICHNLDFIGIDSPGSMQASWTVSQDVLVALPAGLPLAEGALAEPTAVAVHDVRRAQLQAGEKALIVGGGPIGLLIASVARAAGGDVLVLELNEARREFARSLGMHTADPAGGDLASLIDEWTHGGGADVAFEVSGAPAGLDTAVQALGTRGRVVVVAIHSAPPPVDLFRVFWRELTLIGARVYERPDFEQAVALLADGVVPAGRLITAVEPIERVAEAFAELESGRAMKILIDCQAES